MRTARARVWLAGFAVLAGLAVYRAGSAEVLFTRGGTPLKGATITFAIPTSRLASDTVVLSPQGGLRLPWSLAAKASLHPVTVTDVDGLQVNTDIRLPARGATKIDFPKEAFRPRGIESSSTR